MRDYRYKHWLTTSYMALAILLGALPASLQAAQASSFSRWLSREAVPELQHLLSQHPRYRGQRVQLTSTDNNALSEAIVTVLKGSLTARDGITLTVSKQTLVPHQGVPVSIDELNCQDSPPFDYLLQVSVVHPATGQDQVVLELLDVSDIAKPSRSWQWRGAFSSAERRHLKNPTLASIANGSLNAPWSGGDVNAAAQSLSREFACALRPQVEQRLTLRWPEPSGIPGLFADTANTSRHLLGSYRELGIAAGETNYTVDVRLQRFRNDVWQLWLIGTPQQNRLAPVQAVTYFKISEQVSVLPGPVEVKNVAAKPVPPADLGNALDYLDVQILDATQTDTGRSSANLQVTLRIGNRAEWPIEYSFTLSGGHFNHCVARPGYYRHDRYGQVAGNVEAGASVVRRLVIERAQHRPTPLFGTRKCAGFRDLDGFEEFASQGHKVTDFVRWDM
jgi:hypothetical protein